MAEERAQRRLAAILAADVVGYARLMEQDEANTFARLRAHRKELFEPEIEKHHGRVFKLMGDGLLAEFGSVVDAVECAVVLQRGMAERNSGVAEDRRIDVRIGVNLGDVIVDGDDRHGEGVNIAARLQELAEPGGICISQQAFDQVETKLDLAYEDLGEHLVKNIVKAIHVYRVAGEGARAARRLPKKMRRPRLAVIASAVIALAVLGGAVWWYWDPPPDGLPPLPKGPKIALLPFTSMGGNPEESNFADGLTEDITSALSRFSDLFVFPLAATIQYKGESVDPRTVGRELGARYVVKGSVRRSQDDLRVTTQLLDARDGRILWSSSYDRDLTAADVFAVLDDITGDVVGAIASDTGVIWVTEASSVRQQPTDSLEAYDCVLHATLYFVDFAPDSRPQVRDCLERAVRLDPSYSRAWSSLARIYIEVYKNESAGPSESPGPLERADAAARKAIGFDQSNQDGHYALAIISQLRREDYETFEALAETAMALNPNNAGVVGDIGNFTFYFGEWERGKALLERMMKLNPRYPSWVHFTFFLDHYRKAEYREALTEALQINIPKHCMLQWGLAAAYGKAGETEKGKATLDHISTIDPPCPRDPRDPFVKRGLPDELVESLMDGLRKAGLGVPAADQ